MITNDDLDRRLAGWIEAESRSLPPTTGIERVFDVTRGRRPRPAWLAQPGSRWIGAATDGLRTRRTAPPSLHVRWTTIVALLVLGLAIVGGTFLAAGLKAPLPAPRDASGRLAYVLDGVVYLAEWDGRNPVRLGSASASADPCDIVHLEGGMWSPDGRYLAYRSGWGTSCTPTVHISDQQGRPVSSWSAGVGWKVEWAPDSRRVVSWGMVDGTIDIHGLDGLRQAELSLPEDFCVCGDRDPTWAPDGESILVKSLLIPLDGDAPRELLGGQQGDVQLGVRDPSTSADGSLVVFAASRSLFLAPVDNLGEARVLVEKRDLEDPILSPAGDQVAVAASRDLVLDSDGYTVSATYDLLVVDVASGTATTVVTASGVATIRPLAFSSDGDRILFRQVDDKWMGSSLRSVNSDGTGARELVPGAGWGDWQPRS